MYCADFRPRMVYGEGGMVMMGDEGSYQASYDGYSDYSESDDEDSFTRVLRQLVPMAFCFS